MSLDFSSLLLLLLPGFWSLWVYKHITSENLDKRGNWTTVSLGLCFGIFNFLVAVATVKVAGRFFYSFGITDNLLTLEKGFFTAMSFKGVENIFSIKFVFSYAFLGLMALWVGAFAGCLQGKGKLPTQYFHRKVAECLKKPNVQTSCESSLRSLMDEHIQKWPCWPEPPIVSISKIGGAPEDHVMGYYAGFSESEKQINLEDVNLFLPSNLDKEDREYLQNLESVATVDLSSGIVVEFLKEGSAEDVRVFCGGLVNNHDKRTKS